MEQPRRWWARHWKTKLFALFLATAAWLGMVGRDIEYERGVEVALDIKLPEKVARLPLKTSTIRADFRGPSRKLSKLRKPLKAIISLVGEVSADSFTDVKRQSIPIAIGPEHFDLPSDVELLRADPPTVNIPCERMGERSLPVHPRFVYTTSDGSAKEVKAGQSTRGIVGDGWEINWHPNVTFCRPQTLLVSGPETIISKMQYIETTPVDITGLKAAAIPTVDPLDVFHDPELGDVRLNPKGKVSVFISVVPERKQRQLKGVPICFIKPSLFPFSVQVLDENKNEIKTVDLTVVGPADVVEKMTPKDPEVMAAVDLRDFTKGHTLPDRVVLLTVVLPDKVRLEPDAPPKVTVRVSPIKPAGPATPP